MAEDKLAYIKGWTKDLIRELAELNAEKGLSVLLSCGAACAEKSGGLSLAKTLHAQWLSEDLTELVDSINQHELAGGKTRLDGNSIVGEYGHCYCPAVQEGFVDSAFHCNCTRGWLKSVFETLLGRSVEVELEQTILGGGEVCRWRVRL